MRITKLYPLEVEELSLLTKDSDYIVTVEESNILYESMLDKTTKSLEKILLNTESSSKVQ